MDLKVALIDFICGFGREESKREELEGPLFAEILSYLETVLEDIVQQNQNLVMKSKRSIKSDNDRLLDGMRIRGGVEEEEDKHVEGVEELLDTLASYFPSVKDIPLQVVSQWVWSRILNSPDKEDDEDIPEEVLLSQKLASVLNIACTSSSAAITKADSASTTTAPATATTNGDNHSYKKTNGDNSFSQRNGNGASSDSDGLSVGFLEGLNWNPTTNPNPHRTRRTTTTSTTSESSVEVDDGGDCNLLLMPSPHLLSQLSEMFPTHDPMDLATVLNLTKNDLEKAVMILMNEEDLEDGDVGEEEEQSQRQQQQLQMRIKKKSTSEEDDRIEEIEPDKSLKERLVARYGFIDKDEDGKEFRPILPKEEPKKMVRYREGQVVSTKGERYTEVAINKYGEEVKIRSYLSKSQRLALQENRPLDN